MKIFLAIFLTFNSIFYFGFYLGYRSGAESEKFDRSSANLRLQQCLEVIRND